MNGPPDRRTYYGQPVLKEPAWTVEVPWYLFAGGLAGASSLVGLAADAAGDVALSRVAGRVATAGALVSPVLLILDLGRPARFWAMLRVFKITSPLSVGSWLLAAYVPAAAGSTVLRETGWAPRLSPLADVGAGVGGAGLCVYTSVLLANTAIPVWHEARRELPFLFAASSAGAAGAAATVMGLPGGSERRARRLVAVAGAAELVAERLMERRLGWRAGPYRQGPSGRYARAARALTAVGWAVHTVAPHRGLRRLGGAAMLGGSLCLRFAVFEAGFASARDPQATVTRDEIDGR